MAVEKLFSIWDNYGECYVDREFRYASDALEYIKELEEYYNEPNRFYLTIVDSYQLEDF